MSITIMKTLQVLVNIFVNQKLKKMWEVQILLLMETV